jgi:hypothetical protein
MKYVIAVDEGGTTIQPAWKKKVPEGLNLVDYLKPVNHRNADLRYL